MWNYEGAIGGKTGYTQSAGRTLVSCAQKNGLRLICVTINDPDDWDDHAQLYDQAFEQYAAMNIDGSLVWQMPVISGSEDVVPVRVQNGAYCLYEQADDLEVVTELPRFIYAPVKEGDKVGRINIKIDGETAAEIPIVSTRDISVGKEDTMSAWDKIGRFFSDFADSIQGRFGYIFS